MWPFNTLVLIESTSKSCLFHFLSHPPHYVLQASCFFFSTEFTCHLELLICVWGDHEVPPYCRKFGKIDDFRDSKNKFFVCLVVCLLVFWNMVPEILFMLQSIDLYPDFIYCPAPSQLANLMVQKFSKQPQRKHFDKFSYLKISHLFASAFSMYSKFIGSWYRLIK